MVSFNERVWKLTSKIPEGKVTTYAEIAHALNTKAYRAVGNALNKNPHGFWENKDGKKIISPAKRVPCHRVVNSDGRIGGFALGPERKVALLEKEGIKIENDKIKELEKNLFKY